MTKLEGGVSPTNRIMNSPTNKKESFYSPRTLLSGLLFAILMSQFVLSSRRLSVGGQGTPTEQDSVGDSDVQRALRQAEEDRTDALSATANVEKQLQELAGRVVGLDNIVRDALLKLEKVQGERDEANKRVEQLDGTVKNAMEQMKEAESQRDAAKKEVQNMGAKLTLQEESVSASGALVPSTVSSSTLPSSENILDQVVRLLLPAAEADAYIQQHPGNNFKFYLYELPDPYNYQSVAQCIADRYKNASNCDWGFTPCTEVYANDIQYSKRRFNRNGDIVMAKILSDYNGPMRTMDPEKADLFIVPYPSAGHCECRLRLQRCHKNIKSDELNELFGSLSHFKDDNKHRHLFLVSNIFTDTHYLMRDTGTFPLVTNVGPAIGCSPKNRDAPQLSRKYCGQVVMPYVNANEIYQPNNVLSHHQSSLVATKEAIVKERPNGIAAFVSTKIDGNPWTRVQFLNDAEKLNYTIAGLPIVTGKMHHLRTMGSEKGIQLAYKTSIFCPCLRGDYPPQKRIFDAMLSGCIPVVLEAPSHEEGYVSHFSKKSFSARITYPFGQGIVPTIQNGTHTPSTMMGLNYSDLVVAVPESCHKNGCMMEILEDLLANHPETIREKQQNIAKVVSLFSYGMGENGMKYPDAVAAMLAYARQYVHTVYSAVDPAERKASLRVPKEEGNAKK